MTSTYTHNTHNTYSNVVSSGVSTNKQPFQEVLQIKGLAIWIDEYMLKSLLPSATWIHRETDDTAYACFIRFKDAKIQNFSYQHPITAEKVNIVFQPAPIYKFHRLNHLYSMLLLSQSKQSAPSPTLFMMVMTSNRLKLEELRLLFPYAYDIYPVLQQSRAFIQFSSYDAAKLSFEMVNGKTIPFFFTNATVNIMIACQFIKETTFAKVFQQQLKNCSESFKDTLLHEKMCREIVEILFV